MYHHVADFLDELQQESLSTLKLLQSFTDAALGQRVDAAGATLGGIAWHLTVSAAELLRIAGTPIEAPADDSSVPATAAEIAASYQRMATALQQQVSASWTDAMLPEEVQAYGQSWTRGQLLAVLLRHQTHHRGQLTVLARQANIVIPGVCGPTREEMAALLGQMGK